MRWKKWIVIVLVILGAYFLWRKFGGGVKDAIASATA